MHVRVRAVHDITVVDVPADDLCLVTAAALAPYLNGILQIASAGHTDGAGSALLHARWLRERLAGPDRPGSSEDMVRFAIRFEHDEAGGRSSRSVSADHQRVVFGGMLFAGRGLSIHAPPSCPGRELRPHLNRLNPIEPKPTT
ncbi:hypothetical protein [Gordonia sp. NPDC003376]